MLPEPRPSIPPTEYPRRWAQVQALMRAQRLDLLLAYSDDRAVFGPAHARWLADVPAHFEPMLVLFHPEGEPLLLCGPESDRYALAVGRLRDVRVLREFTHPDEDYPYSTILGLAEIVAEAVGSSASIRRVGLGG